MIQGHTIYEYLSLYIYLQIICKRAYNVIWDTFQTFFPFLFHYILKSYVCLAWIFAFYEIFNRLDFWCSYFAFWYIIQVIIQVPFINSLAMAEINENDLYRQKLFDIWSSECCPTPIQVKMTSFSIGTLTTLLIKCNHIFDS